MSGKKLSAECLNQLRKEAVRLRLEKRTLKEISDITGLTRPTISDAYQRFLAGGWSAIATQPRGAPKNRKAVDDGRLLTELLDTRPESRDPQHSLWSLALLADWLKSRGIDASARSVARYAEQWGLSAPRSADSASLQAQARSLLLAENVRPRCLNGGSQSIRAGDPEQRGNLIYAQDGRGQLHWLTTRRAPKAQDIADFLERLERQLQASPENPIALLFKSPDLSRHPLLQPWLDGSRSLVVAASAGDSAPSKTALAPKTTDRPARRSNDHSISRNPMTLTHLQRLEAESIQIMREVVAETENPVMLYSIGKDSAVMLHLALKAFSPSVPPFPLLHVDTTWKFQAMYRFRDQVAKDTGMKLLVHTNEEGRAQGINPFTHGSAIHTDIMKTEALKQALDKYGFDAAFGGARRDEEKSRAKERIFSFRTAQHRWDPKSQRPEIWKLYNARKHPKESIRVFPLSNWTELDIWQYIHLEQIPIVPLYYSAERPVVERDGTLIMVDDERMPLNPGEVPMMKKVRFRTLGCYPLTGAVESEADTLPDIIQEMLLTRTSERQGRMIDHDSSASMEKKKQEGYF